jgi:hypothetical protein
MGGSKLNNGKTNDRAGTHPISSEDLKNLKSLIRELFENKVVRALRGENAAPSGVDETYIFVLMPYKEEWSDNIWEAIQMAVTSKGFVCERADNKAGTDVMQDIRAGISKARIVIADLTGGNPNVTYEAGICDALGKDMIFLAQDPETVPFDFRGVRLISYSHFGIKQLRDAICSRIDQIIKFDRSAKKLI